MLLAGCGGSSGGGGDGDAGDDGGDGSDGTGSDPTDGGGGDGTSASESGSCPSLPLSYESGSITENNHPLTFEMPASATEPETRISEDGELIQGNFTYDRLNREGEPTDAPEQVNRYKGFSVRLGVSELAADSVDAYISENEDEFTVVTDQYDLAIENAEAVASDRNGVTILDPFAENADFILLVSVRPSPAPENVACADAARAVTDRVIETVVRSES